MDYNTQREKLNIPDYGRNVQKMVNYCASIRDREKRTQVAHAIINILGNMNPHLRDVPDYKHKLWDHLAIMSQFSLDIDWPYKIVNKQILYAKPDNVPYSLEKVQFRHYGKYVELFIKRITETKDEKEREVLIEIIANYMKLLYVTWKKEQVADDIIFKEIKEISKGKIQIPESLKLNDIKDSVINQQSNKSKLKKQKNKKSNR